MASEYGEYDIVIRNVVGQIVELERLVGTRKEVDLSDVNSGVYFVTIGSEDKDRNQKVIIR